MRPVDRNSKIEIKIEYGPCKCRTYDHVDPMEHRERIPTNEEQLVVPEAFDSKKVAAFRVREHVIAKRRSAVHHRGVHVMAVVINGERFEQL